jgi:hypothetical protein
VADLRGAGRRIFPRFQQVKCRKTVFKTLKTVIISEKFRRCRNFGKIRRPINQSVSPASNSFFVSFQFVCSKFEALVEN